MSIGSTFTTRLHAFNTIDPRSGPRIIEEAVERAQDGADRGAPERRRAAKLALQSAITGFPAGAVLGLLIQYDGFDMVLSCDDATTWRAHYEPLDSDGFPLDPDERVVEGRGSSPLDALSSCARRANEIADVRGVW